MLVVVAWLYICSLLSTAEDCIGVSCLDEASLSDVSLLQTRLHVDQENLHDADYLQMLSRAHDLMSNPGKSSSADFYNHMAMFSGEPEADPGLFNVAEGGSSLPNYPEVLTALANTSVRKTAESENLHPRPQDIPDIIDDPQMRAAAREIMSNPEKSSSEFYKQMAQIYGELPGGMGGLDPDETRDSLMHDPDVLAAMTNTSIREIVQEGDMRKIATDPVLSSVVKKVFKQFGGPNGIPQEFLDFLTTPRTAAKWQDFIDKGDKKKFQADPEVQELIASVKKKMEESTKKRYERARKMLQASSNMLRGQLTPLPEGQDRQDDPLTVEENRDQTYKSQALHDLEASEKTAGLLSAPPGGDVELAHDEAFQSEVEALLQQTAAGPMTMGLDQ